MPELATVPLCESCGEPIQPWRRQFSTCCDGCDLLAPKKDDLSPVIVPHIVADPAKLPEYRVDTAIDGPIIHQTIDLAGSIIRRVMNTAEDQTKQALIALGWTPPKGKS